MAAELAQVHRKIIVSTDSIGVFSGPEKEKSVWGFLMGDPNFLGFEAIGWDLHIARTLQHFLDQAEEYGIFIAGIHGRLGYYPHPVPISEIPSHIRIALLNGMLLKTSSILRYSSPNRYILLHGPEAVRRKDYIIGLRPPGPIYIENHTAPGSVQESVEIVKAFRDAGLDAYQVFDIFHAMNASAKSDTFEEQFSDVVEILSKVASDTDNSGKPILGGIHLPIGTDLGDSLDISRMTYRHWKLLADALPVGNPLYKPLYIIFENQQLESRFFLTEKQAKIQAERNRYVIWNASSVGIIPISSKTKNIIESSGSFRYPLKFAA